MATPSSTLGETESSKRVTKDEFKPKYGETISVLVGLEEQVFNVHKDLICNKSPFFAAACSTSWTEGMQGVVKLPVLRPATFNAYTHWMYSNKIDLDLGVADKVTDSALIPNASSDIRACDRLKHKTIALFELYIAADSLLDSELKNAVADEFFRRLNQNEVFIAPEAMNYLWEHTSEGCALRRCVLDTVAPSISGDQFKRLADQYGPAFLRDLCLRMIDYRGRVDSERMPTLQPGCFYHDHEEGKKCSLS